MAKSLWNRWFKAKSKPVRRAPRRPARSSLLLEPLEDRCVPTVLFTPVFSGTTVTSEDDSQSLSSPHIDLIFAGSYWAQNPQGQADRATITQSVQTIVNSPYLSDLTQYGSDGRALFDPTNSTSQTNNTPTLNDHLNTTPDIPTLRSFILGDLQNRGAPLNSNTIYCVINDPQDSKSVTGGAGGVNISPSFLFPGVHGIYINTFLTTSGGTQVITPDSFTQPFSHELVEDTVPAVTVSDPGNLNLDNQICDDEPADPPHPFYFYRLNGVNVQAYWSQLDAGAHGAWVVPDGNGRDVTLNATNPTNRDGTYNLVVNVPGIPGLGPVTNNFTLSTDGINEIIDLHDSGQVFKFPLAQLKSVNIDIGSLAGNNTVNVESSSPVLPVNIQLSGGSTSVVNISPSAESLEAIQGSVSVNSSLNIGVSSTLNVDDQAATTADLGSTVHYSVSGSSITRDVNGVSFGGISYSGMKSVNLNGVDQPFPGLPANESVYTINSTASGCATQVNTGAAFATVEVLATASNSILTVVGNSTGDLVDVGEGLTTTVAGIVSVSNSMSGTHLVVDDSQDTAVSNQVKLTAGSVNGTVQGLSAPILYDVNAVNAVDVKGGSRAGSTYTITGTVGNSTNPLTTVDTGLGANNVFIQGTSANGPLQIIDEKNNAGDTVQLGNQGSVQGIDGNVTVNSPSTFTGLFVDDSADPTGRNVTLAVTPVNGQPTGQLKGLLGQQAVLSFTPSIEVMDVKGGLGSDTFTIGDTLSSGGTTLETGAGAGVDTVFVQGTTGSLTVTGSQNGTSPITVGKGGSLKGIKGNVLLQNPPDFNNVTVDGSADPAPTNAMLTFSADGTKGRIIGLSVGEIDYATGDTSAVEVKTGPAPAGAAGLVTVTNTLRFHTTTLDVGGGATRVNVQATGGPLIVNCGPGPDSIFLGQVDPNTGNGTLQNFQGPVTINSSGSNPNQLADVTLNDFGDTSGAHNVFITPTAVTNLAPAQIILSAASVAVLDIAGPTNTPGSTYTIEGTPAAEVLQLAAFGPDTVNVQATAAGIPGFPTTTAILGGNGGHHTFNVGSNAINPQVSTLDGVLGVLNITSGSATDTLNILDQGSTTPHTYTLTQSPPTDTFTRTAPGAPTVTIHFSSIIHLPPPQEGTKAGAGTQAAELAFPSTVAAGRQATMSGRLVGTGTLSLSVDWGDGSPAEQSTPDRRPFRMKHKYARPGTYHVRAVWTDSSGQSGFREMTIIVTSTGEHDDD
jgi:hypothetical protein